MSKIVKLGITLIFAASILLSGCSASKKGNGSPVNGPVSGEKIVLGFNPWPGYYPWFIAKEKGIFAKYGLNVEIVSFPVLSDELSALSSGKLDAAGVTINDLVVPLGKGVKFKVVGVHDISNGGDALVAKNNIQSIADLKGKNVATELGTVDHLLMLVGLQKAGLKESDIKFTNMAMNDAGPALISGKLDAASLYEPFISQAVKTKSSKVLFSSADVPGLITDVIAVKEELATKRPEDVKNLLRAWFEALDYWKANPDESMKIMAKAAETPVEEYKGVYDGIKIFNMDESISEFEKRNDYSSLFYTGNETVKFLKNLNMMNSDPDLDKALDSHFLKEIKAEKK